MIRNDFNVIIEEGQLSLKHLNMLTNICEDDFDTEYAIIVDRQHWKNKMNSKEDSKKSFFGSPYKEKKKGCSNFKMLDEDFVWTFSQYYLTRNSYLHEILENFILELYQHGFMENMTESTQKLYFPEEEPTVLTLEILSAGFFIWLGSVAVAILAFILELISKIFVVTLKEIKKKRKRRKYKKKTKNKRKLKKLKLFKALSYKIKDLS